MIWIFVALAFVIGGLFWFKAWLRDEAEAEAMRKHRAEQLDEMRRLERLRNEPYIQAGERALKQMAATEKLKPGEWRLGPPGAAIHAYCEDITRPFPMRKPLKPHPKRRHSISLAAHRPR